ncbi:hypothetical protein V8C35DRAFT_306369 [Trichoderma chlorosporum]
MEDRLESILRLSFEILGFVALPAFWVETLIFWVLGIPTSTSFRMFPPADIVPGLEYPTSVAYGSALIFVLLIPKFISSDRDPRCGGILGSILHPLTTRARRASPSLEVAMMFARVWLAAAWVNAAAAQFMTDGVAWKFATKFSCVLFIL